MKREFATKILKKAMKHPDHGRDVTRLAEYLGESQVLETMESFPDVLANRQMPRQFKTFESNVEREVDAQEAGISASATAIFSILGITAMVQDAYGAVDDLPLQSLTLVEPSHTYQEPHAWLARPDMPDQINDMEEPSETKILPRSVLVTNSDFAKAFRISRRAIDDDQVGQLSKIPTWIGENHKRQEEIYAGGFLTGVTFNADNVTVPAPAYTDPDGLGNGLYVTSTARQNAIAPVVISQKAIQDIVALSKKIKDWDGKHVIVKLDKIIGGTNVTANAAAILHSQYWPSQPAAAGTNGVVTGTFMTPNPLDPKMKVLRVPIDFEEEPYYTDVIGGNDMSCAWYAIQSKHIGLIKQDRQALETLMESPNAGYSLSTRSYYHRTYRRYAYYIGDARFMFRGNDGSATS